MREESSAGVWHNWSGSVSCEPHRYYEPTTEADLQKIVARHAGDQTIRVSGSGHSFSSIVPTDDVLLSLAAYTGVTDIDTERQRATVRAGTRLEELNEILATHGLALANMGDVDRQTIAGALATGTHGTGIDLGVLATQAVGIRLVTADGEIRTLTAADGETFRAAQVSLGALGVVSEITLELQRAYRLRERTWTAPLAEVLDRVDELRETHRHFEFFWFPHTETALVKTLDRTTDSPTRSVPFDADEYLENAAWGSLCRLSAIVPDASPQLARLAAATLSDGETVGPSHEVFPTQRSVRFNEIEYGVPADLGGDVVRSIRDHLAGDGQDILFPIEFRYTQGDEIPLSPAYGRDSAFIAVHTYHRKPHREYFEACETIFEEHDGRPHWGKMHTVDPERLRSCYPEWDTFQTVRRSLDPEGTFCNQRLRQLFDV
ncbi:D-arabinono-1,4-lactone oxidase [Halocatena salina]|uniref:FAD-binding protein n=1 Tax=Halocatena salina TaxID=2934340 RepID=A0A8U0A4L0_9EURY|nr:D-arabinono-1,4-lactone oxidase [Halocatena salina]UPM42857.1 FAD-binding protein [Halocatena salina]